MSLFVTSADKGGMVMSLVSERYRLPIGGACSLVSIRFSGNAIWPDASLDKSPVSRPLR